MQILATPTDLQTYTGATPPTNATVLLREASLLVLGACQADVYCHDENGLPTLARLLTAMTDATCAQAEAWDAAGINPVAGRGSQATQVTSSSIDGASLSFDTQLTASDRAAAVDSLCPSALRILRMEGLASLSVISW